MNIGPIFEYLQKALSFVHIKLIERTPFIISSSIRHSPSTILVEVINKTKDFPLNIHEVRLHVGMDYYTWYFKLPPHGSHSIAPRAKMEFHLPRTHNQTTIGRRYISNQPKAPDDVPTQPPFNSAADLLKLMASSSPKNVWVEVDFNEYKKRQFLKENIQKDLAAVWAMKPTSNQTGAKK